MGKGTIEELLSKFKAALLVRDEDITLAIVQQLVCDPKRKYCSWHELGMEVCGLVR